MIDLSLTNVNKTFDTFHVLKDINIEVEKGEFVVFVGPSGCGKSTLLRLIAGLENVTSGDIRIGENLVNQVSPSKRSIAMVFQSYALYPHLNVRGNMALALKQEKQPKGVIDQRIARASRMLDLEAYLERFPSELSGGQRQRVAIGRAIVRHPRLFLFDEPLSNLDAALRMNTRIEIANLHSQLNTSMIYVTHDQTEAMTLADKIVVLRNGQIEQVGSPMELYNHPANQFVAGFLGSPAMNFLPAGLLHEGDNRTLGIRPEHLIIDNKGLLAARVQYVEQLGADTNIIAVIGETPLTIRLFGQHAIAQGETIKLHLPAEKIYYFTGDGVRCKN